MSKCGGTTQSLQKHLVAFNSDVVYEWFTTWGPAMGVENARIVTKRRALSGNFQCRPCIQVAAVRTDNPDDPVLLDTQMRLGAGETCVAASVSATTAGKYFARYGVAYSLTSGATSQADVQLDVADDGCGSILGTAAMSLQTVSTAESCVAIGGWVPAIHAAKLKAALVCNGLAGNFQYRLAYRTATTSRESPNAWITTFDQWRGAGEACTGELTPSAGTEMWIQPGLIYNLSSGSALGQATIAVSVSGRKL